MINSILGVEEARVKLQKAFLAHFKDKDCKFELGINPDNGKYAIVAFIKSSRQAKALPREVDNYRVIIDYINNQEQML